MMQATRITGLAILLTLSLLADAVHREAGIAAFNAGRYSVAIQELSIAAADKTDGIAGRFLAMTQAATGQCVAALPALIRKPLDKLAGIAAVKCYAATGETAPEFSTLAELKRMFPNDADVMYLSAKEHMKAFNDETFAMFQRTPSSYRVHQLSADIFEVENRFEDAIAEYRKAIELNPIAPDLHFRLGRALLLESHTREALEQAASEFHAELKLSPEDASCEFQLGQISEVETKPAEAKTHFEQALRLAPDFVQAMLALGKIETADKHFPLAIDLLTHAARLEPGNEPVHYALITAYRNSGQMDKAKAEKATLDKLQKPEDGEFSNFLKKLGEKSAQP